MCKGAVHDKAPGLLAAAASLLWGAAVIMHTKLQKLMHPLTYNNVHKPWFPASYARTCSMILCHSSAKRPSAGQPGGGCTGGAWAEEARGSWPEGA